MKTKQHPTKPTVDAAGMVRVGGITLGEADGLSFIVRDRWRARCEQRGSGTVRIELLDLLAALLEHSVERIGGEF